MMDLMRLRTTSCVVGRKSIERCL